MATLEERVSKLAKEVSALKATVARETGQLEAYKGQQDAIVKRCKDKGFDPADLANLISQAGTELDGLLQTADQKLNMLQTERDKINVRIPVGVKSS